MSDTNNVMHTPYSHRKLNGIYLRDSLSEHNAYYRLVK
jgi:hypothetical protein